MTKIQALRDLIDAVNSELGAHTPRRVGQCQVCGHYGEDCTATVLDHALDTLLAKATKKRSHRP
jgi:hypothetical protein